MVTTGKRANPENTEKKISQLEEGLVVQSGTLRIILFSNFDEPHPSHYPILMVSQAASVLTRTTHFEAATVPTDQQCGKSPYNGNR